VASILPDFEHDIFISYRQNDNRNGWVTDFVNALQDELGATIKEPLSIYFDKNPHDGLHETHDVDRSLEGKLKSIIFVPILSRTYCDPKSFAWTHEFLAFRKIAGQSQTGLNVRLRGGNVANRVLPIKIHELDVRDQKLFEKENEGPLRAIDFVFESPGVNRPLTQEDSRNDNLKKTYYKDQINKVSICIKELIEGITAREVNPVVSTSVQAKTSVEIKRPGLWQELINRQIFRAALAYAITAAVLHQLGALLLPMLEWPDNVLVWIDWLLAGFFPVALMLAWLFELSPDGFVRIGSPQSKENPYSPSRRKPLTGNFIISLMLILVITQYFYLKKVGEPFTGAALDKSIAVLPFRNMSGDKDQEYFSDGMMHEVINQLVKIPELSVVSLPSAMIYRDSEKPLNQIGDELGVTSILEGSVQRLKSQVRISVRLLDVSTDKHLWSESYVRDVNDIFAIQASISENIAHELKAVLSTSDKASLNSAPTTSNEAYDYYLKSLYYERKDDWINGIEMCNQALKLDPNFTLAYVLRSNWNGSHFLNKWPTWEGRDKLAKADLLKAIQLNPELPEVRICQAITLYRTERNYAGAVNILEDQLKARPNDAQVYYWLGLVQRRQGLWREAINNMERAVSMDPRNSDYLIQTSYLLMILHQYPKAIEYANRALASEPDAGTAGLVIYNSVLAWKGNVSEANDTIAYISGRQGLESISDSMRLEWARYYYTRKFDKLLELVERSKTEVMEDQNYYEPRSLRLARIYYLMGNSHLSKKWAAESITFLRNQLTGATEDYRIYSALGYSNAYLGNPAEAIAFGKKATEIMPFESDPFSDGLSSEQALMEIYIITGKYDLALDRIEFLLTKPGNLSVPLLRVDPVFDPLRTTPRFNEVTKNEFVVKY